MSEALSNITKGTDLTQPGAQTLAAEAYEALGRKFAEQTAGTRFEDKPRDGQGRYMQSYASRLREATAPKLDEAVERAMRGDDSVPEEIAKAVKAGKQPDEGGTGKQAEEKTAQEKASAGNKRDLESALKALRLDGFDDADLDGMTEERIVALGKKAAKRQADVSKRLETASKQQQKPTAEVTDDDADDDGEEPEPSAKSAKGKQDDRRGASEAEESDDDELVGRILPTAKELSELYGEEEFGRPLAKTMARVMRGPMARVAQLEGLVEQLVMENARANLRERFPQVEQDEHREALADKMRTLAGSGAYSDVRSLMRDAAMTLWGEQMVEQARNGAERKSRSAAAPIPQRKTAPRPMTEDERLDAAIEAAMRGARG